MSLHQLQPVITFHSDQVNMTYFYSFENIFTSKKLDQLQIITCTRCTAVTGAEPDTNVHWGVARPSRFTHLDPPSPTATVMLLLIKILDRHKLIVFKKRWFGLELGLRIVETCIELMCSPFGKKIPLFTLEKVSSIFSTRFSDNDPI